MVLELFGLSERAILGPIWGSFWDPFRLKMGAFGAHFLEFGEIDLALTPEACHRCKARNRLSRQPTLKLLTPVHRIPLRRCVFQKIARLRTHPPYNFSLTPAGLAQQCHRRKD